MLRSLAKQPLEGQDEMRSQQNLVRVWVCSPVQAPRVVVPEICRRGRRHRIFFSLWKWLVFFSLSELESAFEITIIITQVVVLIVTRPQTYLAIGIRNLGVTGSVGWSVMALEVVDKCVTKYMYGSDLDPEFCPHFSFSVRVDIFIRFALSSSSRRYAEAPHPRTVS